MNAHTSTATCRYCSKSIAMAYDPETDSPYVPYGGSHSECISQNPTGQFIVRTIQNAVKPPRINEKRYGSVVRAREVAADIRASNPREYPCGAQLEISVLSPATLL